MEQGHICKPGSAREPSVAIDTRANAQAPTTVETVIEGEKAEDIIEKCHRVPSHTLPNRSSARMIARALTSRSAEGLVARTWGSAKEALRYSAQTECGAASLPVFSATRLWSGVDRGLSRRVVDLSALTEAVTHHTLGKQKRRRVPRRLQTGIFQSRTRVAFLLQRSTFRINCRQVSRSTRSMPAMRSDFGPRYQLVGLWFCRALPRSW